MWKSPKFIHVPATVVHILHKANAEFQYSETRNEHTGQHSISTNQIKNQFWELNARAATNAAEKLRRTFMVHI